MGSVWLAEDSLLGRPVALKRVGLLPGADSTDLTRAEREARLAARLDHPHVVAVFDLVADPGTDARWLVMEYVDGMSLAEAVARDGPFSPDDAAPLLQQVAGALAAAHAAGIVHRDVKPSNVLLDRDRRARLTDFGIARIATDPVLTQTGMLTGSPAYLAPEVAAGERGGAAADVWSLGATAFHLLAGRPPYEIGDHVLAGLYRIVHDDPPRLDDAGWLSPLLDGTLVKDPERRWSMSRARDFLADPAGRSAVPVERPPATRRSPAVRGLAVATGAALVAALAVGAALLVKGAQGAGPEAASVPPSSRSSPSSQSSQSSQSSSPSRSATPVTTGPSARGMESFVRSYVTAVAAHPKDAWRMLTPKFQRESGGLARYRAFWHGVGAPHLLAVHADPHDLVVRYRVRFDHFGTGRRPTVLDLSYDHGRYRIDGERTRGFVPAG